VTAKRLHNLDYLRGIAAAGIMVYHYTSWVYGRYSADEFMARVGVYGVSVFYVLSGLTLYHVYIDKLEFTFKSLLNFSIKRIFRIYPMLWLATLSGLVYYNKAINWFDVGLNLSGLFGFFKWDVTFSTGIWSIGNELVFYTLFPIFLLTARWNKLTFWMLMIVAAVIYAYFCFVRMYPGMSAVQETRDYFNPLNNLFLFASGIAIGLAFTNFNLKTYQSVVIILFGIGLWIFYPVTGARIDLLTGWNRIVFGLSCVLICLSFYKFNYELQGWLHVPLSLLGEASYSVYLVHPLIFKLILGSGIIAIPKVYGMLIAMLATLVVGYLLYRTLEKWFIRLGQQLIQRLKLSNLS
jgi:exopolysaccharide production protein ExoZ